MSAQEDVDVVLAAQEQHDDDSVPPTGLACELETPRTYMQAQAPSGPDNHMWTVAMDKEMTCLHASGTSLPVAGGGGSTGDWRTYQRNGMNVTSANRCFLGR